MRLIQRIRDWLSGKNTCPECGAVHYKLTFGVSSFPCPDCFSDALGTIVRTRID